MAIDGFIFDLDGVLIDSNGAHVKAWLRAFRRFGYNVEPDRLALEMGKGGDKLVRNVLGERAGETRGHALRAAEKEEFARVALEEGLRVAPGAQELLAELRRRQVKTALATSSSEDQVELAERASRVRWRYLVDEVVTASDVNETKPAPDLVLAAMRKLKMAPTQCAMLGDAPWDAQAASRAGVVLVGVTRGGSSREVLLSNGARVVYQDPAEVLSNLDEVLRIASPGTAQLDAAFLERLMGSALATAQSGWESGWERGSAAAAPAAAGGVPKQSLRDAMPFGCLIASGSGEIVATAFQTSYHMEDLTGHAELEALRRAVAKGHFPAAGTIMFCTVEPCVMCTGAAMNLGVDTIVFALAAPEARGTSRIIPSATTDHQKPRVVGGVMRDESRRLLEAWLLETEPDLRGEAADPPAPTETGTPEHAQAQARAETSLKRTQTTHVRRYLAQQQQ